MHHFVLVHGAWHGAWCWEPLVAELERQGAQATARDLPGHGDDPTPLVDVDLDAYVDRVCAELRELDRRVELVGHSMAGVIASVVADRLPGYLTGVTYLAAYVPRSGDSASSLARDDADSLLPRYIHPSPETGTLDLDPAAANDVFYHDCDPELAKAASEHLCPQPLAPLAETVELAAGGLERVPKAYVACEEDRAVSPRAQHALAARAGCEPVIALECGHSPFMAQPERLADSLLRIAEERG